SSCGTSTTRRTTSFWCCAVGSSSSFATATSSSGRASCSSCRRASSIAPSRRRRCISCSSSRRARPTRAIAPRRNLDAWYEPVTTTSGAKAVDQLVAQLPDDRRREVSRVLEVIRRRVPAGYVEGTTSGMISWTVPLSVYPDTYNKQPLWYAALAPRKNYVSLHLPPVYSDATLEKKLRDAFAAAGKRLDMVKG